MSENDAVNQQAGAWFAVIDAIAESNPTWWDQEDLTGKECAVKAIRDMAARIAELEAQVQAMRDDAERLDWLESDSFTVLEPGKVEMERAQIDWCSDIGQGIRSVIDAARAAKG